MDSVSPNTCSSSLYDYPTTGVAVVLGFRNPNVVTMNIIIIPWLSKGRQTFSPTTSHSHRTRFVPKYIMTWMELRWVRVRWQESKGKGLGMESVPANSAFISGEQQGSSPPVLSSLSVDSLALFDKFSFSFLLGCQCHPTAVLAFQDSVKWAAIVNSVLIPLNWGVWVRDWKYYIRIPTIRTFTVSTRNPVWKRTVSSCRIEEWRMLVWWPPERTLRGNWTNGSRARRMIMTAT